MLCKVFNVNRSTYYKYISNNVSPKIKENQIISRVILKIYETTISDLVHIKLLIFWSEIMVLKLALEEYID